MESSKDLRDSIMENISVYRKAIVIFSIIFLVIILSYYISDTYRIKKTMERLHVYEDYMNLNSQFNEDTLNEPLCNFYVASAFRPYICKNQMGDYLSTNITKKILRYGARCLYIDVFTDYKNPVISVGYKKGNWKLSLNNLTFNELMNTIATNAFRSGIVNNYDDPLILALNLNVKGDFKIMKKIKEQIIANFGDRLLDISYGYAQKNIAMEPLRNFMGKVIILCSEEYQNSSLEEIVNGTWNSSVARKINNVSIDPNIRVSTYVKEDTDTLINFNKNGLTLIMPEEGSMFSRQYNPKNGIEFGCQFNFMIYQEVDGLMDYYITKFRSNSFILKPVNLKGKGVQPPVYETLDTQLSKEDLKDPIKANCNINPLPYVPKRDYTQEPLFKKEGESNGMCFISKRPCDGGFESVSNPLNLIANENNKDLEALKKGDVNINAGIDVDGFKFHNVNPYVCCAKTENVPIRNKYIMTNICDDPTKNKGMIGIKVKKEDANKTGFIQGKDIDSDYKWMHPKICEINDVTQLRTQDFCVFSSGNCPSGYEDKKVKLENNYNLCCKKAIIN